MPLAVMKTVSVHENPEQLTFSCLFKEHVTWDGRTCVEQGLPPFVNALVGPGLKGDSVAALVNSVNLQRHQNCASVTCVRSKTGLKGENNVKFCKSRSQLLMHGLLDWVWVCLFHSGPLKLSWKRPAQSQSPTLHPPPPLAKSWLWPHQGLHCQAPRSLSPCVKYKAPSFWWGSCSLCCRSAPALTCKIWCLFRQKSGQNGYRVTCSPRFEKSVKLSKTLHDVFYFIFIF